MLLQSPVSSVAKRQKDKLLMTARVTLSKINMKNQPHRTRILLQPRVEPEDVRYKIFEL